MKLPGRNRRGRETIEVVGAYNGEDEEAVPSCTFDDDADPSIERCWDDLDGMANQIPKQQQQKQQQKLEGRAVIEDPFAFDLEQMMEIPGAGAALAVVTVLIVLFIGFLLREHQKARQRRRQRQRQEQQQQQQQSPPNLQPMGGGKDSTTKSSAPSSEPQQQQQEGSLAAHLAAAGAEARVKELKLSLERETKEKQGLSEQNNFLKSALEERKATVQMFTSELQSRDEQLANFEQEQSKVKNELYQQIEILKKELASQEQLQQQNLNQMDGQCADLAGKVEGLMKELAAREEQWERFEKEAKAKEIDSAAQIDAIKKEFAAKEQEQTDRLAKKQQECAELNRQLERLAQERSVVEQQAGSFSKQREKWTTAARDMRRMLQEKRGEIAGLMTRMELFLGELKSRQERLNSLEEKLTAKTEQTESELRSLRTTMAQQQEDHDGWSKKTVELEQLLAQKEQEARELTIKVENLTKELGSTSEKVTLLEAQIRDKEFVVSSKQASLDTAMKDETTKRAHWADESSKIIRLFKAREEECASLTARVEIFATELQSRETIVESLEKKVQEKEGAVASQLQALEANLRDKQAFRDTWSQSTKDIHRLLEEKQEQCVGLSTRVELFQMELSKRQDRVKSLESVLEERQGISAAILEPYETQLKIHQADLDTWTDKTSEIKRLLQERKGECIGLTTRLSLFKKKLIEYENQFDVISKKVKDKMGFYSDDISPLKAQLQKQQDERDLWVEKTREIGLLLRDRQGQCVGLTTRLVLFQRQTQMHQEQVKTLVEKTKELQERFDLQIIPLQNELKNQREGLDSWRNSTLNVEKLLKQAEQDKIDLTAELRCNLVKMQGFQKDIAALQEKVLAKEDLAETHKQLYLSDRQKEEAELDKWSNNTKDLQRLLQEKQSQIVGLTTRLSLFETELATRQTAVTTLEAKVEDRQKSFDNKLMSLQNELRFQREQRDHCLESTLHMNKSMKEVKEPCIGLTTRLTLFRKELDGREERVRILEEQIREKEEIASAVLGPLRNELEKQRADRDKWNQSTLDIFWMLKERQDKIVGLTTRLELFMSELQKKEEVVDNAEASLKGAVKELAHLENMKKEVFAQEEQRCKWNDRTNEIALLLQQKEEQRSQNSDKKLEQECLSLSAKLELFRGELQRREEKVESLQSTIKHKGELLAEEKASLEKQIPALKEDRDSWMEKTLKINQTLKAIQAECVGLTTRGDLFKTELNNRKESVASLEMNLKEKEDYYSKMIDPYKKELQVQMGLREKWFETIEKMDRLLKMKETECVNFTTQLETSIDELTSRKEQVANLEAQLSDTQELSESEMTSLNKQLAAATESLTTWKASTQNIESMIKEKRQECANLRVRLQVFNRQVETQNNRIATLESAYKAKKDDVNAQMEALQTQLRAQQAARDDSVSTTLDINEQIKAKDLQCTSISVRLSLFRSELVNREKCVATLENKLSGAKEMSALKLDPVEAQLAAQKEELAKWTQNTQDVEQLLKKRDEERIGLSTRLKLFQLQLKTIEESVAKLEQRVKEREEAASSEMAPIKNALDAQRAERDRWTESTMEIQRLLQDRKGQITGLTTRLSLFRKEVKHREQIVSGIESKLREKQEGLLGAKIEPVQKELKFHQQQRDEWAKTTDGLVRMLREKRGECHGLTTRLSCFKMELQKREEVCNVLMKKYNENKDLFGSQVQVLKSELAMQTEQRDKWRETTAAMRKQLEDRKAQCTGLSTRVALFQKEIQSHDEVIARLKLKVTANNDALAEVEQLKKELQAQKEHCDTLGKAVAETDQLLKEKKEECAGLATRLVVFRQQLKERIDLLASTGTKIKEKEDLSAAQIESLKIDLQAQREQRNKWTETTEELKQLLSEKESQCSIISAELELLTALQVGEA